MSELSIKGRDEGSKTRDERRKLMEKKTEVTMRDLIAAALNVCGVTKAEIQIMAPPNLEVRIEADVHSEKIAKDIAETLEDSTGVGYVFNVVRVPVVGVEGITFIKA